MRITLRKPATLIISIEDCRTLQMSPIERKTAVAQLLRRFEQLRYASQAPSIHSPSAYESIWELLCAAHIAGQHVFSLHLRTHSAMLSFAWQHKQYAEVSGQLFRLALVFVGHAIQRLPTGNPGRATMNAFKPVPVPPHLQRLISEAAGGSL